jgi:hypothetical protein
MLREFLSGVTLLELPLVAMGLFMVMFVAVLVRVSRRSRSAGYRHMAELPLQDDTAGRSAR